MLAVAAHSAYHCRSTPLKHKKNRMKKNIILLLLLQVSTNLFSQKIITQINKEKLDKIDDYISYIGKENQDIGTISIFQNGKEIYKREFGKKKKLSCKKNNGNKLYQIGSITKMFTALLLWQLKEKGELDFNEPLANYFPEMPNSKNIKIKHMLNHRSGLGNYAVKNDTIGDWLFKKVNQKEILNEIKRQGVLFEADSSLSYSNSAYYLLAKILEKKYKKSYESILKENIIKPLHLHSISTVSKKNIAVPYQKIGKKWYKMNDYYFPNLLGAGNITSNMTDLNIFINALFDGKIISKENLKAMLPEQNQYFGMGIMWIPVYKKSLYGHGGDTRYTHTILAYDRENKISISFSLSGQKYDRNDFFGDILNIMYEMPFKKPAFSDYIPNFKLYKLYQGKYKGSEVPNIEIYKDKKYNLLMAKSEGYTFKLEPIGKDKFKNKSIGLVLEFNISKKECVAKQNGKKIILNKVE